jgi:hypothetical protein
MTREQTDLIALAGAVVLGLMIWAAVGSWSPEAWTALAAWVTVGVAAAAGYAALGQLNETARLRREQAQPYVVVYIEPSAAGTYLIDLVMKTSVGQPRMTCGSRSRRHRHAPSTKTNRPSGGTTGCRSTSQSCAGAGVAHALGHRDQAV